MYTAEVSDDLSFFMVHGLQSTNFIKMLSGSYNDLKNHKNNCFLVICNKKMKKTAKN